MRPAGLTERAYEQLKEAIVSGQLRMGEPLFETRLAGMLGMSRTPVREALRDLTKDGLVELNEHGFGVARLLMADMRELFQLRESLEGLASSTAARTTTPEEIERLEEICVRYENTSDVDQLDAIGNEFHGRIVSAARNARLSSILDSLTGQIILSRRSAMRSVGTRPSESAKEHRAILDAIRAGDPSGAEAAARAHVRRSFETTLRLHAAY